jgi:hypothetical protein
MRLVYLFFCYWIFGCSSSFSQEPHNSAYKPPPDAPSATLNVAEIEAHPTPSANRDVSTESAVDLNLLPKPDRRFIPMYLITPRVKPIEKGGFQWEDATAQSFLFLSVQHGLRMLQPKTRTQLGGAFWGDYAASISGIHGWGDGDGPITNYILHPGEGGISSFIFIQNSPTARHLDFDAHNPAYWRSRLKAMAFAAAYSTQFEIGLYSEASLGNVGKKRGTSGYVDFVMTPIGGFAFTVIEDAVDRKLIQKLEQNQSSLARKRFVRVILNPERSIANLLRFKTPWYRDTRTMPLE